MRFQQAFQPDAARSTVGGGSCEPPAFVEGGIYAAGWRRVYSAICRWGSARLTKIEEDDA